MLTPVQVVEKNVIYTYTNRSEQWSKKKDHPELRCRAHSHCRVRNGVAKITQILNLTLGYDVKCRE